MSNYLLDRKQRVIVNGTHSDWCTVKSGVPQGATLGPLHFLLYVNDLPDKLTIDTNCGIFADDTKIVRNILTNNDIKILQNDIDQLFHWSKGWGLNFNTSKCMVLSLKRTHLADKLNPPRIYYE